MNRNVLYLHITDIKAAEKQSCLNANYLKTAINVTKHTGEIHVNILVCFSLALLYLSKRKSYQQGNVTKKQKLHKLRLAAYVNLHRYLIFINNTKTQKSNV